MNKLFTELPAPKRTHRLSIVAVWNPIDPPELECEHTGCEGYDYDETSECPVCGRWMCDDCFGFHQGEIVLQEVTLDRIDIGSARSSFWCCKDCSKLTNEERQSIMDLRMKMNQP